MNSFRGNGMTLKRLSKNLKSLLDNPVGLDDETYHKAKRQYRDIKKLRERILNDEKAYRGFGYNYAPIEQELTSETDLSDATSGADDGVRSEGEQPTESGEPECGGSTEVLHQA